jgi:predicted dehydrogenase
MLLPNRPGAYRSFWLALVSALRGTGPNPVTPQEALAVMEVLDAGSRSAATRSEIAL